MTKDRHIWNHWSTTNEELQQRYRPGMVPGSFVIIEPIPAISKIYMKVTNEAYRPKLQSTLVISKSKTLTEILWIIRTSTYQICRFEKKNKSNNHISQMNM